MYKHLLVPIDSSPLSAANVQAAVQLARSLGARITFFHATADYAATSEGALLHASDPEIFEEAAVGVTNAVLLKALASANAAGVPCTGLSRTSDRPAEVIVEAATEQGADLIVMASRGVRGLAGWLHSSQTERVLRKAPVALLVTRVEANEPLTASERALGMIHDEHRSIAVVMASLRRLAASPTDLTQAELHQLDLLLGYLRDFPQRLHHPKEEQHLHRCLRARHPDSQVLLAELESQHTQEAALIAEVQSALQEQGASSTPSALRGAVSTLVSALGAHMAKEESMIFPMARNHLKPEDWEEIATAFEAHNSPRFGELNAAEFDRLFTHIANLKATRDEHRKV